MRVSLSDEAPPSYLVLTAPATKGGEKWRNAPKRGIARARFLWLGHELLGVCVHVGIEPPDRLAQLLRILDTHIDTTPGGLCLQTLSETSLAPLVSLAWLLIFHSVSNPILLEVSRILNVCYGG